MRQFDQLNSFQALAIKMVVFMHWWVSAKSKDILNKGLLDLVRERRVIVVRVDPLGERIER